MINNNISYYLTLTFRVRALRGELHSTLPPVQLPDLG
jgi:hypothetical protein